jgi:hypothetical protein
LIGGLKGTPSIFEWSRRWVRFAGECKIERYRDGGGGISYMLKRLRPDEDFDLDIKLKNANRASTPYD